jgi:hypothetical protein
MIGQDGQDFDNNQSKLNIVPISCLKLPFLNMLRGTVVGMTALFGFIKPSYGVIYAGASVGIICFLLGFLAIATISETQ